MYSKVLFEPMIRGLNKRLLNSALLLAFMTTVGCVSLDQRTPEERVEARAVAQAQALLDQDYEMALQYTVPSFRSSPQARSYEAKFSGAAFWVRFQPRWVRCEDRPEPESCEVRIWIYNNVPWSNRGYSSDRGSDVPISWDSTWIKVNDEWYQFL